MPLTGKAGSMAEIQKEETAMSQTASKPVRNRGKIRGGSGGMSAAADEVWQIRNAVPDMWIGDDQRAA
jgi:hypothetical protein